MGKSEPNDAELAEAERRIEWVLAHPGMSVWLKNALRTASDHDPVQVLNDLEILRVLLGGRVDSLPGSQMLSAGK